jgi:hypothetical protein
MSKKTFAAAVLLLLATHLAAQEKAKMPMPKGTAFGIQTGLAIGIQKWNGSQREPLFAFTGSMFMDFMTGRRMSTLIQLGYSPKGSSVIQNATQYIGPGGQPINIPRTTYNTIFHNLSMILGAKSRFAMPKPNQWAYFMLGIRGEYTLAYDRGLLGNPNFDDYINKFNWGPSLGGGYEMGLGESNTTLFWQLHIAPDVSYVLNVPNSQWTNPFTLQTETLPAQRIRNMGIELVMGVRFHRDPDETPEEMAW